MPSSTKGLGCITNKQTGLGEGGGAWLMTWLRQALTGEEASDITDKGDVLRLGTTVYMDLTSLYVHLISIAAPRVKGRMRAEPKQ